MLSRLTIRNIVLIEYCDLVLSRGLCVLTGETGAGKSILLDALGLALGRRTEARLVRPGGDQASVAAQFDISGHPQAQALLEEMGLEPSEELFVRRTLTQDGKTRCFLNDTAVSVAALKNMGDLLVEINGQHDGRGLLNAAGHRLMLDGYGGLQSLLQPVRQAYQAWKEARETLEALEMRIEAAHREKDYLEHLEKELAQLAPQTGEEEALASSRREMMGHEKLAATLADAESEITQGKGAQAMIASAQRILARSAFQQEAGFAQIIEAFDRAGDLLAEAEEGIARLARESRYDAGKLERMEERLFALRGAGRKHQTTPDALPALLAATQEKLKSLQNEERERGLMLEAVTRTQAIYLEAAERLSQARVTAARALEEAVHGELITLKMASTRFQAMIQALPPAQWSAQGKDSVEFMAATNAGMQIGPLAKIASGGELSRFMLAMKVALARVRSTPTLIFDEIDTGTGGAVADAIGQRLARLGQAHQVLVVTHLPQVAARGDHHLRIHKQEKHNATVTEIEPLSQAARADELARMLAGAEVTPEARLAAQKLLQAAS